VGTTKITAEAIKAMKGVRKISALTAYDVAMTRWLDDAGMPLILVGDSLGMVVLGYPDTTMVTMDDMEHHVRAAARAKPSALLVADLPYHSYGTPELALENSRRLLAAGAEAVKAEGGRSILDAVTAIVKAGIPFLGHLGMLPQSIREEGGYHVKGKLPAEHDALLADADALAKAGAFALVLELVTASVAAEITARVPIPTVGIGSGNQCDGQILVTTDLLGTSPGFIPKHARPRPGVMSEVRAALTEWRERIETT
jgi:3-methyl-2-oxobutanoate hydroxymethyltransferase